jgi:hypothetical protein
VAKNRYAA